jgi:hypothetical protein
VGSTAYYAEALWGNITNAIATNASPSGTMNLNFTCSPPKAIPTFVTAPSVGVGRSCGSVDPASRYENLQWNWNFDNNGDGTVDVDGFYIYAQNPSGVNYRVGKIAVTALNYLPLTNGSITVQCIGANGTAGACWNISDVLSKWDPTIQWTYTMRPYINTLIGYEPMVGYKSASVTATTCP